MKKKIKACEGKCCSQVCGNCHHYLGSPTRDDYTKCYVYGNYKRWDDEACDHFYPRTSWDPD